MTVITDARGRKLTLRKLNVLDQVKLLRAIGPDQSNNQPYVMIANLAASVSDIDGVPVPMPTKERDIDACIARLDDDGFNALRVHFQQEIADAEAAAEAAVAGGAKPGPLEPSASS